MCHSLTYLCRAGAIDSNDTVIVFKVSQSFAYTNVFVVDVDSLLRSSSLSVNSSNGRHHFKFLTGQFRSYLVWNALACITRLPLLNVALSST